MNTETFNYRKAKALSTIDTALARFSTGFHGVADMDALVRVAKDVEGLLACAVDMDNNRIDKAAQAEHISKSLGQFKGFVENLTAESVNESLKSIQDDPSYSKEKTIAEMREALAKTMDKDKVEEQLASISAELDRLDKTGERAKQTFYTQEYQNLRLFASEVMLMGCFI